MARRRARCSAFLAVAATALACGETRAIRAVDPAQALDELPNEAQGEVGGVAVRAALGGWRGDPRDLEQKLTPVDVSVRNAAGRAIRLGPEAFGLVVDGVRLRVLTQDEVSRALSQLSGFRRPRPPRSGAVGGPTFPGYDGTDPFGPRSASPANAPVPSAGSWHRSQPVSGTLEAGRGTSVLLFFEVPARGLRSATFEVDVVGTDGAKIGTIQIPFGTD